MLRRLPRFRLLVRGLALADRWWRSSTSASRACPVRGVASVWLRCSGRFEDLVEVPLQEIALRPVCPALGEIDDLACSGVELVAITEVLAQPRADEKVVTGVDADISAVKEGMDVRPQQQPVVEAVLTARRNGSDMRSLQDRCDVGSADGATAVIGVEDDRLERALAESVGREAWVTEYRAGTMPGLVEVKLYLDAQEEVEKFSEVRCNGSARQGCSSYLERCCARSPGAALRLSPQERSARPVRTGSR